MALMTKDEVVRLEKLIVAVAELQDDVADLQVTSHLRQAIECLLKAHPRQEPLKELH